MFVRSLLLFVFLFPILLATNRVISGDSASQPLPPAANKKVDFRRDVYPLLSARCYRCHKGADAKSGFRLDLRTEILGETNGKPLVKIGKSAESRLIHAVANRTPGKRMPKNGKPLTPKQIGLLRAWIDQGLVWDESLLPTTVASDHWSFRPVQRPAPPKVKNASWVRNPIDAFIAAKQEEKGLTPAKQASPRTLIRRLSLDLIGLPPSPEEVETFLKECGARFQSCRADGKIGVLPHGADGKIGVLPHGADGKIGILPQKAAAYQKLVDRLLQSPHYGERWARHWLDVARWAESEGYESNHLRLFAWRYRDYVVRSFNDDKPFDRFIIEQIAGDELTPYSDENIIATGFLAAARLSSNEEDKWRQRNDIMVDIANTTASAFLGLTMNCAQCHNHKFDPITTRDYYRFQGCFIQGQPANLALRDEKLTEEYLAKRPAAYEKTHKSKWEIFERTRERLFADAIKKLPKGQQEAVNIHPHKRTKKQEILARQAHLTLNFGRGQIERAIPAKERKRYQELKKQLERMKKEMVARPQTFGFYSPVTSAAKIEVLPMKGFYPLNLEAKRLSLTRPHILIGGEVNNPGPLVGAGWPAVFGQRVGGLFSPRSKSSTSPKSRRKKTPDPLLNRPRLALAKWIASKKNPLTARVYVNRLWQHHFGRGIVATPADFGKRGSPPTHPKLLDWLADEFMRSGWSTKHVQRLIVTSSTYRQRSGVRSQESGVGGQGKARRQRSVGNGASTDPENRYLSRWRPRRLEAEAIRDSMLAVSGELDRAVGGPSVMEEKKTLRRSLYLFQKRDFPPQSSALFDGPSAVLESCSRRHVSTVPLQALYLLNNDFVLARAKALAVRVQKRAGKGRDRQIDDAFLLTLGRRPDSAERKLAHRFFAAHSGSGNEDQAALVHFCQALLNVNEFVYLE